MPEPRLRSVAEALREAVDICLERDPAVYLIGEGVTDPKAIFGTTSGLVDRYGRGRVIEMPVSESGLTGIAIGSALMGRRPIMVHQRVEFSLLAFEQLVNNAAKTHYVTNGHYRVPLTIRLIVGRGWGQGPMHSQSLESVFAHFPGLKVIMPSLAADAKGMLIAAVEDDNPVVFIEHRWVHYATGNVPEGHYTTSLKGSSRLREGGDVTIVAASYSVYEALQAATALAKAGVKADIFDLRVYRPLDLSAIIRSVRRTGRLLVVDTGWRLYGAGAEIVATVVEQCFPDLRAAPRRIGLPDHPTPSSRALVQDFYPTAGQIIREVAALVPDAARRLMPIYARLDKERKSLPIDVPNPEFRGPF